MYTASDLKKGLKIMFEGQPWIITDFDFSKPGKGQAIYNCRLRNMLNGSGKTCSFRSNDRFERSSYFAAHHILLLLRRTGRSILKQKIVPLPVRPNNRQQRNTQIETKGKPLCVNMEE